MRLLVGFFILCFDLVSANECWDKNAEYKECGSDKTCESNCGMPSADVCIQMCVSRCVCKAGHTKDYRGMCISNQECASFLESSECFSQSNAVNSADPPLVGAFIPSCDENGNFSAKQCHGSTGYCWCAHRNGTKIENTETRGDPKCTRQRTCRESHDEGLAMLAEVNGMIADYALADCQTGNPDLWVALTSHPMMENCMCLDPLTGAVIRHDHDCSQSCDQYSSVGNGSKGVSDIVEAFINLILQLLLQFFDIAF